MISHKKTIQQVTLLCISFFFLYSCKENESDIYNKLNHSVEFINPNEALGDTSFKACDESYIFNYYNPEIASYKEGKKQLRNFITSNYINKNYSDSGYLNILFVINCRGEAGRYRVIENDLNLEPKRFNEGLKTQLLDLTMKLKYWNPNFIKNQYRDSSMYLSYRIENGEITEILP